MSDRTLPQIKTRRTVLKLERAEYFKEEKGGMLDRRHA
jgi:hypothetical protein